MGLTFLTTDRSTVRPRLNAGQRVWIINMKATVVRKLDTPFLLLEWRQVQMRSKGIMHTLDPSHLRPLQ